MTPELPYQNEIALAIVRVLAGVLFFFQGYDKVFRLGIRGVYATFYEPMHKRNMPGWILWSSAIFTSVIELVGGGTLMLGLLTPVVAVLLLIDILLVAVAFSMLEPMWDMKHVFPRLLLLLILITVPYTLHIFSIDYLLFK